MVNKIFFLVILLFLSFGSLAEENAPVQSPNSFDCGVENGKVIMADGSLCKDDLAFNLLIEYFPSATKVIVDFFNISEFKEHPVFLQKTKNDSAFTVAYSLFFKLVLLFIGVYIVLLLIDIVLKSLTKWQIFGDKNAEHDTSDKLSTYVFGGALVGIFLYPVKKLYIGPLVIFGASVLSLFFANYMFSVLLSAQQSVFSTDLTPYTASTEKSNSIEVNRHDYLSDSLIRYLVRIELCHRETTNYIMKKAVDPTLTSLELKGRYDCAYGNNTATLVEDFPTKPSFVNLNTVEFQEIDYKYLSKIDFSLSSEQSYNNACVFRDEQPYKYHCGAINIQEPNWGAQPLVKLLGFKNFFLKLKELNDQLSVDLTSSDLSALLSQKWLSLSIDIQEELLNLSAKEQSDLTQQELSFRQSVLNDKNKHNQKKLLSMWYQAINNTMFFGQQYSRTETRGESPFISEINEGRGINRVLVDVSYLADLVEEIQCNDFNFGLDLSDDTLQYLLGNKNHLSSVSTRCLNLTQGKTIGYQPENTSLSDEEKRKQAVLFYQEKSKKLNIEWLKLVNKYSAIRKTIEKSYQDALENIEGENIWIQMRKEGFLSIATYAYKRNQEIDYLRRGVSAIVNHFSLANINYDDHYISRDVLPFKDFDFTIDGLPVYMAGDQAINNTQLKYLTIDRLVNNSFWISTKEQMMRQQSLYTGITDSFDDVFDFLSTPTKHLDQLGLSLSGTEKSELGCLKDASLCPFPVGEPLIGLSQFGQELFKTGATFYVATLSMKGLIIGLNNYKANRLQKGKSALPDFSSSMERFSSGKTRKIASGVMSTSNYATQKLFNIADLMYQVLGDVMLLMIILGALLYYGLPLIIYLYVYFGFISWTVVVVMASFSIFLLSMYWLRLRENRTVINSAMLHYGIELLFKPSFLLITVLFAYHFFYIVAFIVGVSLNWLTYLPNESHSSIISVVIVPIIHWIIILFIYLIGLKYCYKLMDDMSQEMLQKLGVNKQRDNDKISEFIKAIMFDFFKDKHAKLNAKLKNKHKMSEQRLKEALRDSKQS